MQEAGVDISQNRSKHLSEFLGRQVETVITVCDNADEACPIFPGQVNRHHWPYYDPAKAEGSEEELMKVFRQVRYEIKRVFEAYSAGRKDEGVNKRAVKGIGGEARRRLQLISTEDVAESRKGGGYGLVQNPKVLAHCHQAQSWRP